MLKSFIHSHDVRASSRDSPARTITVARTTHRPTHASRHTAHACMRGDEKSRSVRHSSPRIDDEF